MLDEKVETGLRPDDSANYVRNTDSQALFRSCLSVLFGVLLVGFVWGLACQFCLGSCLSVLFGVLLVGFVWGLACRFCLGS